MTDAPSLFEAEALGTLERSTSHGRATEAALSEAVSALEMADQRDLAHQLQRARELHRLFSMRLASITRQLAEGRTP